MPYQSVRAQLAHYPPPLNPLPGNASSPTARSGGSYTTSVSTGTPRPMGPSALSARRIPASAAAASRFATDAWTRPAEKALMLTCA
jgi:hypothetical protein